MSKETLGVSPTWSVLNLIGWLVGTLAFLVVGLGCTIGFEALAIEIQREYPLFSVICAGVAIVAAWPVPSMFKMLWLELCAMRVAIRERRWR